MTSEKKKVLELLAAGKITAEEAEKLLDKLEASGPETNTSKEPLSAGAEAAERKPRYLRIQVERPGGDHVNMRVPLSFARSGSGLLAVLPLRVSEKLAEYGIDFSEIAGLKGEKLDEALQELNIDIDRNNGKKVRIFCE